MTDNNGCATLTKLLMHDDFKLCYVASGFAYFTTQDVKKQWGDDWNDAPYEHNAGSPYDWREGDKEKRWDILKVGWEGAFDTPDTDVTNSKYSVEDINKGMVPWLESPKYEKEPIRMFAGTTLGQFIAIIKRSRGSVYLPMCGFH